MTTSGNTDVAAQPRRTAISLSRYDLVLAIIPSAFVLSLLVGVLLSAPMELTLLPAAMVGTVVLADALFLNPPVSGHGRS